MRCLLTVKILPCTSKGSLALPSTLSSSHKLHCNNKTENSFLFTNQPKMGSNTGNCPKIAQLVLVLSAAFQPCQFLHIASQIDFSSSCREKLCETSPPLPPQCFGVSLKYKAAILGAILPWQSHPVFPLMFSTYGCEIQCLTSFLNIES